MTAVERDDPLRTLSRDELLAAGSRANDDWQAACKLGGGEPEKRRMDAVDDELRRRDGNPLSREELAQIEHLRAYDAVMREAAVDQSERDDPSTARIVEARDEHAAAGRFDLADATQRVIDSIRAGATRDRDDRRATHTRDRGAER